MASVSTCSISRYRYYSVGMLPCEFVGDGFALLDADDGQIVARRYARHRRGGRPVAQKRHRQKHIITSIAAACPQKHAAVSKSGVLSCNFVYQRQIQL